MINNYNKPVFNRDRALWTLNKDGNLFILKNGTKHYISSHKNPIQDYYTFDMITTNKNDALELNTESILKNNYDPNMIPILEQGYVWPGGGKANIFSNGECKGYYVYFEEQ